MNIQVATSELPIAASIRTGPRLAASTFPQRSQAPRFRGARGAGATVRGTKETKFQRKSKEADTIRNSGIVKGRGAGRRGGGRGGAARTPAKTPTAEELDAELEAYVKEVK